MILWHVDQDRLAVGERDPAGGQKPHNCQAPQGFVELKAGIRDANTLDRTPISF